MKKILFLTFVIFNLLLTSAFSQTIGGGGLGKPLSASLGGLINTNVFKSIAQPKNKQKVTSKAKTATKVAPVTIAKSNKSTKSTGKVTPKNIPTNENSVLTFSPVANSGIDRELAQTLSKDVKDQEVFLLIFKTVKTAYDAEAIKKGRKNDVAMAVTFFIATCLTVYHETDEPTDRAIENVYQTLANSMIENGNLESSSDLAKQEISDRLVYISGLILAGYLNGKQTNDANSTLIYQQLAGVCLQTLMGIDPDKMRFNQTGLEVN